MQVLGSHFFTHPIHADDFSILDKKFFSDLWWATIEITLELDCHFLDESAKDAYITTLT